MVAIFEKMSGRGDPLLHGARRARADALNELTQRAVPDLDQQMQVVGHPAVTVQARVAALKRSGNDLVEATLISWIEEYALTVIPPECCVIKPSGHVQSRRSCHAYRSTQCASSGEDAVPHDWQPAGYPGRLADFANLQT